MILFVTKKERINKAQKHILDQFYELSPTLRFTLEVVREFRCMMFEQKCSDYFYTWIDKINLSGIPEFQSFSKGLLKDTNAIKNAIDLPWSNGPVEGNVNKLKTLKRQMYVRCSIDLLEKRLVLSID
ncbi:hypothetical protein BK054_15785 [Myroides sp. ZB35]|nr:transposase [Myroides sp. ZB35]APA93659.1 hypothetical protein BK054_15785 [Myroides sp. ZB35]